MTLLIDTSKLIDKICYSGQNFQLLRNPYGRLPQSDKPHLLKHQKKIPPYLIKRNKTHSSYKQEQGKYLCAQQTYPIKMEDLLAKLVSNIKKGRNSTEWSRRNRTMSIYDRIVRSNSSNHYLYHLYHHHQKHPRVSSCA